MFLHDPFHIGNRLASAGFEHRKVTTEHRMQKSLFPLLIICSGVVMLFVGHNLRGHPPSASFMVNVFTETKRLEQKYEAKLREVADLTTKVERLDPGPPPPWYKLGTWNPGWASQHKLYLGLESALQATTQDKQKLEDLLKRDTWHKLKGFFSGAWGDLVRPVLEFLLLLGAFSFGVRVFWRSLLMRGTLGVVRV